MKCFSDVLNDIELGNHYLRLKIRRILCIVQNSFFQCKSQTTTQSQWNLWYYEEQCTES